MPNNLTKKEIDDFFNEVRRDPKNNIFYTAPLGYFWQQGIKRRNHMINTLIKILEKRGYLDHEETKQLLDI